VTGQNVGTVFCQVHQALRFRDGTCPTLSSPVHVDLQSRLARMGQMVGFARATSDGVLSATIWDVSPRDRARLGLPWTSVGLRVCHLCTSVRAAPEGDVKAFAPDLPHHARCRWQCCRHGRGAAWEGR
jgi:hypothetical protein